ncbi:hypothetical protein Godav_025429, partial [Gossypium davidsonii]|nr:hypothetical protein [Gossypium davidsonii]
MTDREKHNLSTELESLLGELPENIVDIDALRHETLYKLRKLLDDYLL